MWWSADPPRHVRSTVPQRGCRARGPRPRGGGPTPGPVGREAGVVAGAGALIGVGAAIRDGAEHVFGPAIVAVFVERPAELLGDAQVTGVFGLGGAEALYIARGAGVREATRRTEAKAFRRYGKDA